ncbi:hypothetical protein DICSQDRAFT_131910 [Dichomitus squalens LYAD-421 SS1]|uniref:uncharacterized protein n=1 Tax=Dichomitus squalens (strain LYAD-421) TaxID=732165 RepID=UPI000441326D|nr:uncharacterized protein DICSQDRAFT_131910 [Dichomitus squalens LYAD-421 SS1]EJF65697.1 hypothetical protein DICSQDRAFT_131910 [Dichomitus squalens LYAD-421 SS1]
MTQLKTPVLSLQAPALRPCAPSSPPSRAASACPLRPDACCAGLGGRGLPREDRHGQSHASNARLPPRRFGHSPAYSPDADFGPAPPVNKAAHLLRRTIPTLRPAPSEACHPQRLITAIILLCPERRRRLIAAATVAIPRPCRASAAAARHPLNWTPRWCPGPLAA